MRVHITHPPDDLYLEYLHNRLTEGIQLSFGLDAPSDDYEILVDGRPSESLLDSSDELHSIIIPFAGVPGVTQNRLRERPHLNLYNLHHNAASTAEFALALLFAATKRLMPADNAFRQHDWRPRHDPMPSFILERQNALVLGYGQVGQRIATVLRALSMEVIGVKRSVDPSERFPDPVHGVRDLPQLLPHTRVLMISLPLTEETRHLIDERAIRSMPHGAVIVNVGRAAVVEERALYNALRDDHLHGAAFDVWYQYPKDKADYPHYPPAQYPFHRLDNMVMSPHRAGGVGTGEIEEARMVALANALNAAFREEPIPNPVNVELGY